MKPPLNRRCMRERLPPFCNASPDFYCFSLCSQFAPITCAHPRGKVRYREPAKTRWHVRVSWSWRLSCGYGAPRIAELISPTISSPRQRWRFVFVGLCKAPEPADVRARHPIRRRSKLRLAALRSENSGSANFSVGVRASDIISGTARSRHGWHAGPRPMMDHG